VALCVVAKPNPWKIPQHDMTTTTTVADRAPSLQENTDRNEKGGTLFGLILTLSLTVICEVMTSIAKIK
jgi:hypothetical protein